MKPNPSRFTHGIVAAMIAACAAVAVTTVVEAQTPPPTQDGGGVRPPMPPRDGPRGGGEWRGGPGMPGGHDMRMMREALRLKTSLQLNAQQSALWDRAVAAMKPQGDMREQMRARHDRMAAMLDDPNFDPRKMAAEMDRTDAERRARMGTVRDAWFSFYDSLNPVQRGQVREFLRSKMARHEHGMRGPMGGMHPERGGKDGQPMAPQTPPTR